MRDEVSELSGDARHTLMVVESGEFTRHRLKSVLRAPNREIYLAASAKEAMLALHQVAPQVIFVSMEVPDLPGVGIIDVFREHAPGIPIVAITEESSVDGAIEAIRRGAVDYLGLSEPRSRMLEVTARALREALTTSQIDHNRDAGHDRYGFSQVLTQSPRMLRIFDQVRAVATTEATVLIRGATGTGKELISRAIHERSRRRERPFISVNCGAFTESLLESELFGHEKGSFTGASGRRAGLFEMADGGTLFLDELGETSLNVQVNLLRVLEEMTFRRVGGRDEVRVDVRIIAATNVDLETAVEEKRFRGDLYYRLNVFPIHLPPLSSRREDIPLLMRHFLDAVTEEYALETPAISADAMQSILAYEWPGNVRQLRAMCERWVITRAGQRLEKEHLPPDMTGGKRFSDAGMIHVDDSLSLKENARRVVEEVERAYLFRVLKRHQGHLERTAKAAGITRRTLYTKMKQFGLAAEDFR